MSGVLRSGVATHSAWEGAPHLGVHSLVPRTVAAAPSELVPSCINWRDGTVPAMIPVRCSSDCFGPLREA